MARALALRLSLAVASVTLVVLLLEGSSHLFGSFEGPKQPLRMGYVQIFGDHDPLLFWSLRPDAASPNGTPWTNSDGLRGPEIGPKQPGEYRILSLGESTTFAAQLLYEYSYSAVLEALLNERPGGPPLRVLNAGVPGYTLFQGVQFLVHRGLRFEPDMVLLYFGYNDFLQVGYLEEMLGGANAGGMSDRELFEARRSPTGRAVSALTEHSNFFRGMLQLRLRDRDERAHTVESKPRVPEEDRLRLLEQARDFCAEQGLALVIVIPIYRGFHEHVKLLRSFAGANGIPAVDLPARLPPRFTRARASYFLDSVHPVPETHRLIAEEIHDVVAPRIPGGDPGFPGENGLPLPPPEAAPNPRPTRAQPAPNRKVSAPTGR